MGAIGMAWGGAILARWLLRTPSQPATSGAYAVGQYAAIIFAALLLLVGAYYFFKKSAA